MIICEKDIKNSLTSISKEILNGINYDRSDFSRNILNYPAMMVPSAQEPIIRCLSEVFHKEVFLFDPFMGASNTLVTGMKYGLNIAGQDINPLSLLLSKVKTNFYEEEDLINSKNQLRSIITKDSSSKIEIKFRNVDKWFKIEVQSELSKIYRGIRQEQNIEIRRFYWVTLAEVIRLTSNDRTSTFKMHIRSKEDIESRNLSPVSYFFSILDRSIKAISSYCSVLLKSGFISEGKYSKRVDISWGDSSKRINSKCKIDLLVTSPPYGDNQTTVTYGQFSYLPLQWIPVEDIDSQIHFEYLKTIQQIDSSSLGGKMVQNFSERRDVLFTKSRTLKNLFEKFNVEEEKKAKKIINFISDLDETIEQVLGRMNSNAFMVWTVGNRNVNNKEIENDKILTELLSTRKIELVTDLQRDILSKRMPCRNNFSNTMNEEKILIFKTS